jgi:hypothetical protein
MRGEVVRDLGVELGNAGSEGQELRREELHEVSTPLAEGRIGRQRRRGPDLLEVHLNACGAPTVMCPVELPDGRRPSALEVGERWPPLEEVTRNGSREIGPRPPEGLRKVFF